MALIIKGRQTGKVVSCLEFLGNPVIVVPGWPTCSWDDIWRIDFEIDWVHSAFKKTDRKKLPYASDSWLMPLSGHEPDSIDMALWQPITVKHKDIIS